MINRSELETQIQYLLGKINHRQSHIASKKLAPIAMTHSQVTVLLQFMDAPEKILTTTQLVQVMSMNQPGVTKIVKQLLDVGYLEVVTLSKDKRLKELKVTEKGLSRCEQALSLLSPISSHLFLNWESDELKELGGYLERINSALNEPISQEVQY